MENENEPKVITEPSTSLSWIQRLKDESWEAELLVSAIAIYGTFQLFDLIEWSTNKFIDLLSPDQYIIAYSIVFIGLLAVSILVSMFVIHFFLRAYWVGLVGLNSVFPDYSLKNSAYSEIYTKKIISILPKLKDSLQKVDALCSVIFSAAFCILLIYAYLSITASIYLLVFNILSDYIPKNILLVPILIIAGIILLQSILGIVGNLKVFKKNEKVQLFLFKIVKLASFLMYGPLYKYLLQITMIFGSNFKKNKALIRLILLFIACGMVVAVVKIPNTNIFYLINNKVYFDNTKTYSGYYNSENMENNFLLTPEISSDIVNEDVIKIFIPIFGHEKRMRADICGTFEKDESISRKENNVVRREFNLQCYHQYNLVFLNDQKVSIDYMKYEHPRTKQFGIIGYVSSKKIKYGKNVLTIKKISEKDTIYEWSIPFFYSGNRDVTAYSQK